MSLSLVGVWYVRSAALKYVALPNSYFLLQPKKERWFRLQGGL